MAPFRILADLTGDECDIDLRMQSSRLALLTLELFKDITLNVAIVRAQGDIQELKVAALAYAAKHTPERFDQTLFQSNRENAHGIPGVDEIGTDADILNVCQGSW